jgi:hypothetical protein
MSPHVESRARLMQVLQIGKKGSAGLADLMSAVCGAVVYDKNFEGFHSVGLPLQRKERCLQMTGSIAGWYNDGEKHQSKPGPIKVRQFAFPFDQRAKVLVNNPLNPLCPAKIVQKDAPLSL